MTSAYFVNEEALALFVKKWKRNFYLSSSVLLVVLTLYSGNIYHKYGINSFILYVLIVMAIITKFILFFFRQLKEVNKTIVQIEFSGDKVKFSTLPFSLFGGLVNKRSIEKECNRSELSFSKSDLKYTFNKGGGESSQIYSLVQQKIIFRIVDSFFDDFEELKKRLESFHQ